MTRVLVNFADQQYVRWQRRLEDSLSQYGNCAARMLWTDTLPPGSPKHSEWSYAFKLYAIKAAREKGFKTVVWVDAGLYAIRDLTPLFESVEASGVYVVKDDGKLSSHCSDETFAYFKMPREEGNGIFLAYGGLLGFDFTKPVASEVFDEWFRAFEAGLYRGTVSKHSGQKDHRGDEAILAIILTRKGIPYHTMAEHYGADADIQPTTIFRSGYVG